ncbi:N-(5'-phosphoribosyl)anthranilate isomerase [Rhodobacter sp. SGA-6-6]|uniref:N-(5'-phosphoribosyl)anthranilate isomerase n=1 Tax=Rhodobacter sp. SGA-6-6 TaxID=2710882 RepID=UPI0013EB88B7|nr:N-(5'-phosphoribosyl)anthranilate isomerase [Rhodobacter sp. SGA-6-6]NGM47131.1 N-(5'-phosphoribosyl)anthranilate isomerase [Rhodobacter sp. SGA-6-6]
MSALPPLSQDQFFGELFASKAARDGAVIRRQVRDVERYVGRAAFMAEIRRRGFSLVENAGQFVIFCNRGPLRRLL